MVACHELLDMYVYKIIYVYVAFCFDVEIAPNNRPTIQPTTKVSRHTPHLYLAMAETGTMWRAVPEVHLTAIFHILHKVFINPACNPSWVEMLGPTCKVPHPVQLRHGRK